MTAHLKRILPESNAFDFIEPLAPWHLGGIYAYLANSLTIGAMVTVGFLLLTYAKKR